MSSGWARYPELDGRAVCVTGAARGIGLTMAQAFAANGCHLALVDIDAQELAKAHGELAAQRTDREVIPVVASVTDPEAVARGLDRLTESVGRLDVMINNAGVSANVASLDLDLPTWQRAVDINLTGVFVGAQAAARRMRATGGGAIINVASIYGIIAAPGRAAYCATKAAVVALTKVLAAEWAGLGIRVNGIGPGYIETDLVRALSAEGRLNMAELRRRTPLGRLGTEADVAQAALFLASAAATNITGHVLISDGGFTADGYGLATKP